MRASQSKKRKNPKKKKKKNPKRKILMYSSILGLAPSRLGSDPYRIPNSYYWYPWKCMATLHIHEWIAKSWHSYIIRMSQGARRTVLALRQVHKPSPLRRAKSKGRIKYNKRGDENQSSSSKSGRVRLTGPTARTEGKLTAVIAISTIRRYVITSGEMRNEGVSLASGKWRLFAADSW